MLEKIMKKERKKIHPNVIALGFSLLSSKVSSELFKSMIPIFMTSVLGTGVAAVGFVGGFSKVVASIIKVYAGRQSDRAGRRKQMILWGFLLSAFAVPFFAMAKSALSVVVGRSVDRLGKGLRYPTKDALVGDVVGKKILGKNFGFRESLGYAGGIFGPLLAFFLIKYYDFSVVEVLWISIVPAIIAVLIVKFFVVENAFVANKEDAKIDSFYNAVKKIDKRIIGIIFLSWILSLPRFSDSYLILYAKKMGFENYYAPFVFMMINIGGAFSAYPFGKLADKIGSYYVLAIAMLILTVSQALILLFPSSKILWFGFYLWGVYKGIVWAILLSMVSFVTTKENRGVSYGAFGIFSSFIALISAAVGGFIWDKYSPEYMFVVGAVLSCLIFIALLSFAYRKRNLDSRL
jgi:MFS family permease